MFKANKDIGLSKCFSAQQCKNHTCIHCSCCHLVSFFNTDSKQHFIWNATCKNILKMQVHFPKLVRYQKYMYVSASEFYLSTCRPIKFVQFINFIMNKCFVGINIFRRNFKFNIRIHVYLKLAAELYLDGKMGLTDRIWMEA